MLQITDAAASKINELVAKKEDLGEAWALEFNITAGGCAGFQYQMDLKNVDDDIVHDINGTPVVMTTRVMDMADQITIDYVDGLMESGFKITNADANATCGCGQSFR